MVRNRKDIAGNVTIELSLPDGRVFGINYTELAEHCGMSVAAVQRYFSKDEEQQRVPSLEVMKCIGDYLGLSLDEVSEALGRGVNIYNPRRE